MKMIAVLFTLLGLPPVFAAPVVVPASLAGDVQRAAGSDLGSMSEDGRFIAFASNAQLIPDQIDTNGAEDVYLFDRRTDTVTLVSRAAGAATHAGDRGSTSPTISDDGAYIAFVSEARDLVEGFDDHNGRTGTDVFLYERATATITLISHAAALVTASGNSFSFDPATSGDASFVAFTSRATDLIADFVNANGFGTDVFLYERATGTITLISHASISPTKSGNEGTAGPGVISRDGAFVTFASTAGNLIPGFVNGNGQASDVFLNQVATNTNVLASRSIDDPRRGADGHSTAPTISHNGAYLAFESAATDLMTGFLPSLGADTNIFLFAPPTDAMALVSHQLGSPLSAADARSSQPLLDDDGAVVAFESEASDLVTGFVDGNGAASGDLFLWQRGLDSVALVSHAVDNTLRGGNGMPQQPTLSLDGAHVAFESNATDLVAGFVDTNGGDEDDVYRWSSASDTTTLISHAAGSATVGADGPSGAATISSGGAFVLFASFATDLVPGEIQQSSVLDLLLFEQALDSSLRVSRNNGGLTSNTAAGESRLDAGAISAQGRWVVFTSEADNLVRGRLGQPEIDGVFLYDRLAGTVTLVSHAVADPAMEADGASGAPVLSGDGAWVAFESQATDLIPGFVDANGNSGDLFLFEAATGEVTLASRTVSAATTGGNGASDESAISADGRFVAFRSAATDLVGGFVDNNGSAGDVFLIDRTTAAVTLVSHGSAGALMGGDGASRAPQISHDSEYIVFESTARNLVEGFVNGNGAEVDLFLFERATGQVTLISHAAAGAAVGGNRESAIADLSDGARYVAFESNATDLVDGFVGGPTRNVFFFERATGTVTLISHADGKPTTGGPAVHGSKVATISSDGAYIAFQSRSPELIDGLIGSFTTPSVFLYDRATNASILLSHAADNILRARQGTSPVLSADGGSIVFVSSASDLIAAPAGITGQNIYRLELGSGEISLISHDFQDSLIGSSTLAPPVVSHDGLSIAFAGSGTRLVDRDLNQARDVFLSGIDLDADLTVSMTDSPDPVSPGAPMSFTLDVWNAGPGAAPRVLATTTLPPGAELMGMGGADWTCDHSGSTVACHLVPPLPAGASSPSLTIDLAAPIFAGSISTTASVSAAVPDFDPLDNGATTTTTIAGSADLAVSLSPGSMSATPGDVITYTVTASNLGTDAISPVSVEDVFPAGLTCQWTSAAAGGATGNTAGTGTLAESLFMPAGSSVLYTVICAVDPALIGTLTNTATIGCAVPDPDLGNNSVTATTTLTPQTDLALEKSADRESVDPGGTLRYTLAVTNLGPSASTGASTTDPLPIGLSFASSQDGCTETGGIVTCPVGPLDVGTSTVHRFVAMINPDAGATIDNSATVAAFELDPVPGNDDGSEQTTVENVPPTVARVDTTAGTGDGQLVACESARVPLRQLQVIFSEPVGDPAGNTALEDVTNPANYRLIRTGPDLEPDTTSCSGPLGDDEVIPIDTVTYDAESRTAHIDVNGGGAIVDGVYRFLVCGVIEDAVGNLLDGDGNLVGGDDFLLDFRVDEGNEFANGNFDCLLDPWIGMSTNPNEIVHSFEDVDSSNASGSVNITNLTASRDFSIGQCVETPAGRYLMSTRMRLDAPTVSLRIRASCDTFPEPACAGPLLFTVLGGSDSIEDTGGFWQARTYTGSITVNQGVVSALCRLEFTNIESTPFDLFLDRFELVTGIIFADGLEFGTGPWSQTIGEE